MLPNLQHMSSASQPVVKKTYESGHAAATLVLDAMAKGTLHLIHDLCGESAEAVEKAVLRFFAQARRYHKKEGVNGYYVYTAQTSIYEDALFEAFVMNVYHSALEKRSLSNLAAVPPAAAAAAASSSSATEAFEPID